jgi:geranylgeranyl reductase family protein
VTQDHERCDVLVIGAGPAGAAAATVVARTGADVLLVDGARFPRDKTCGDAVSNHAMAVLDELGAGDALRAQPHALVRSGVAIFPDGASVARGYEQPGYIVPRLALDDCVRSAAERAGARLLQGLRVDRLLHDDRGAVVGAAAGALRIHGKVVIAADGYGSVAWPALGIATPRGRYLGVSSTLYARGTRHVLGADAAEHFFEHDLPCGYAWLFPDVDGLANLGVYLRQDSYVRQRVSLSTLLARFVARHPDRFDGMQRVGRVRTWSLPLAPAPWSASAAGLLLVGDAGNFIDPMSGEGIWQALFTGVEAGRTAAEAVHGRGLDAALRARFEAACQAAIRRPSRGKAVAQELLHWVIAGHLYRLPPMRAALRFAYTRKSFEMTKG